MSTCVIGRWLQETMEMCGKSNRGKNKKTHRSPCKPDKLQLLQSGDSFVFWKQGDPQALHSRYYSQTDEKFQPVGILGTPSDSGFEFGCMELMGCVVL